MSEELRSEQQELLRQLADCMPAMNWVAAVLEFKLDANDDSGKILGACSSARLNLRAGDAEQRDEFIATAIHLLADDARETAWVLGSCVRGLALLDSWVGPSGVRSYVFACWPDQNTLMSPDVELHLTRGMFVADNLPDHPDEASERAAACLGLVEILLEARRRGGQVANAMTGELP